MLKEIGNLKPGTRFTYLGKELVIHTEKCQYNDHPKYCTIAKHAGYGGGIHFMPTTKVAVIGEIMTAKKKTKKQSVRVESLKVVYINVDAGEVEIKHHEEDPRMIQIKWPCGEENELFISEARAAAQVILDHFPEK